MKLSTRILAVMLVAAPAFAAPKCAIAIKEKLHDGKVESTSFRSDLRSQRECEVLAGLHRKNWSPSRVKEKRVAYAWNGVPAVARLTHKRAKANVASRKSSRTKRQTF